MTENTDTIKYINDLAAGIFNLLTNLESQEKIGLYAGHKKALDIGPSETETFSKFGYHKDGLDLVGCSLNHREYLDWVNDNWTEAEKVELEKEIFDFVMEEMDASGFNDESIELTYTIAFERLDNDGLEDTTFAITMEQVFDWSNVDKHILESALTKIFAVHTFIVEFLNIMIADEDYLPY